MNAEADPIRLLQLNFAFVQARALQLVAELGVADLLADGPRTVEDLAVATSTHPDALRRLLRALAGCDVFTEQPPHGFALTATGHHLRTDHPASVRSFVMVSGVVSPVFIEAMHSLRTGDPTFPKAFGEPFFDYLRSHPEHGALFDTAMADRARLDAAAVVDAYDFAGARRVVDVGGGNGTLLAAILHANPETTGVLFDQPHVVDAARERIGAEGLADRCAVSGGDFFSDDVPDGDVYLLRLILHDWPDDRAAAILRNCRRAMAPGDRLLIIEEVPPAGDAPHPAKINDFIMLLLLSGRERTGDEHAALLAEAGLRLTGVVGTASAVSVIEAVPADE